MGVSSPNLQTYIDYLELSFIVRRLNPYYVNIGKRLVKSPKLYFRDTGVLHYLANVSNYDSLITNVLAGHSWESYVIDHIINKLSPSILPFFYRIQN